MKRRIPILGLILAALLVVGCGSSKPTAVHSAHVSRAKLEYAIGHSHHSSPPLAYPHGRTTHHALPGAHVAPKLKAAISPSPLLPLAPDTPGVTPSGGWKIAYGDTFTASLSTDSAWIVGNRNGGCCGNGDEVAVERPSQATTVPDGVDLRCEYVAGTVSGSNGSFYDCAGISNRSIAYQLGQGATLAFELYAKLPYSTGSADPGWWGISLTRWPPEPDWFEEWAYGSCFNPSAATNTEANKSCIAGMPVYKGNGAGSGEKYAALYNKTPPGDPSQGFHRYTTIVSGSASSSTFTAYIDGVKEESLTTSVNTDQMSLILTNAMRTPHCNTGTKPNLIDCYFKSGTHDFVIRSAAIYVDGSHAGKQIIAPGTQLEGETPPPPPVTTEETTPPPPPPAPEKPAAPTGVIASSISTSTSPGVAIKWTAVSGATSYKLYRAGNENIEGRKPGEQWGGALSGPSAANHQLVTLGGWYCYRVAAINANGQGPYSSQACATA